MTVLCDNHSPSLPPSLPSLSPSLPPSHPQEQNRHLSYVDGEEEKSQHFVARPPCSDFTKGAETLQGAVTGHRPEEKDFGRVKKKEKKEKGREKEAPLAFKLCRF
ncbi:hypothetical protein INR49_013996 [Caranx melampygus]|nr:hypothetical protein INR49_013996 [Caranx melampygus]